MAPPPPASVLSAIPSMVAKDLRRRRRAPLGTVLLLAFPLIFAGVIALAFGGGEVEAPTVSLLLENRDDGLVGELLTLAFSSPQAAPYFEVEEVGEEGRARLEEGEASALLRLPAGLTDNLLDGEPVTLELVRNPAQSILPEIAEQSAAVLADALGAGAVIFREPLERIRGLTAGAEGDGAEAPSAEQVSAVATTIHGVLERGGDYLFPPAITLEVVEPGEGKNGDSGGSATTSIFLLVLPGVAIFALFLVGDTVMRDLLTEARQGTLRRQLAAPVPASAVVAAKALTTATVAAVSLALLSAIAWAVKGEGVSLAGFALLSLALVVAVAGFASMIYGLARTEGQGATFASIAYLGMGFASGSFVPLSSLPAVVRAVAPFTLFYWPNQGFRALLEGGGVGAVALPAAVLAGVGLPLLALGSALLARRLRRGGAS